MNKKLNRWFFVLVVTFLSFSMVITVNAFAEEKVYFIDPANDTETDDRVSTIHFDITYILAIAAGFSEADAETLQIFDQLVDSEQIGPGDTTVYSNCYGEFKPSVDPTVVCEVGTETTDVIWPMWSNVQSGAGGECVTSRFGPYSPFFHFPYNTPDELGMIHDWGWGYRDDLIGYSAYAWDGMSVLTANCAVVQPETIDIGIPAGSLEAFGTYLHSLKDYYSHRDCLDALAVLPNPPLWGTHTLSVGEDIEACNYNPALPNNLDAHGREFGTVFLADSSRTDEAIQESYKELVRRSLAREGVYYPLDMDVILTGLDGSPTLQEALYQFVHNWNYTQAAERRAYGVELLAAISDLSQNPLTKTFIPIIIR